MIYETDRFAVLFRWKVREQASGWERSEIRTSERKTFRDLVYTFTKRGPFAQELFSHQWSQRTYVSGSVFFVGSRPEEKEGVRVWGVRRTIKEKLTFQVTTQRGIRRKLERKKIEGVQWRTDVRRCAWMTFTRTHTHHLSQACAGEGAHVRR